MQRGVIYIVWGSRIEPWLERSMASLKAVHPELPVEVFRLGEVDDPVKGLLEKSKMMRLTPFEETLFLDADTVVIDRLDFGFEKAAQFGFACAICECPWARRYSATFKDESVEYNTGVLFFTRKAAPVFELWEKYAPAVDSTIVFLLDGKKAGQRYNDQAAFAKAVADSGMQPFVLPLNWNYRPQFYRTFFGPLKVWHGYAAVPAEMEKNAQYYRRPNAIIQFHQTARR